MCQAQESNKMLANSSTDTNLAFDKARCHRELFYCSLFLMGVEHVEVGDGSLSDNQMIGFSLPIILIACLFLLLGAKKRRERIEIKKKKTDFVLCHQVHEDHLSLFWGDK